MSQPKTIVLEVIRTRVTTGTVYMEVPVGTDPSAIEVSLRSGGDMFDMFDTNCGVNDMNVIPGDMFDASPLTGTTLENLVHLREQNSDTLNIPFFHLSDADYCNTLAEAIADHELIIAGEAADLGSATEATIEYGEAKAREPICYTSFESINGPGAMARDRGPSNILGIKSVLGTDD